jgi:hypothetical protein
MPPLLNSQYGQQVKIAGHIGNSREGMHPESEKAFLLVSLRCVIADSLSAHDE